MPIDDLKGAPNEYMSMDETNMTPNDYMSIDEIESTTRIEDEGGVQRVYAHIQD